MQNKNGIRPWRGCEDELWAEPWVFKITVHLDDEGDFSDVLNACKQQLEHKPFYCLSNFMGCIPKIRVSTSGSSKNHWQRFCTWGRVSTHTPSCVSIISFCLSQKVCIISFCILQSSVTSTWAAAHAEINHLGRSRNQYWCPFVRIIPPVEPNSLSSVSIFSIWQPNRFVCSPTHVDCKIEKSICICPL